MRKYLLPESGNFYKANLHCHTTCSDGKCTPEQIKQIYRDHGYSIVAFTDHDVLLAHDELRDETFLPLHGYEMEINEQKDGEYRFKKTCHICLIALEPDNLTQVCYHRTKYLFGNAPSFRDQIRFDQSLPDYERVYSSEGITEIIRTARKAGFFVTYNHPEWSQESYPEYMGYHGMNAMEICNYGCLIEGYDDYNPRVYDDMLRGGERIYCTATDDNHNGRPVGHPKCDSFGGFTVIKAESLDYRAVTAALEAGHFYASQGPEIRELYLEDGAVRIVCSPARKISLHTANRRCGSVVAEEGKSLTEATFPITPADGYFRLTVEDHRGKPANTNAYFTDEVL